VAITLNNKVGLKINAIDLSDHVTSVTLNQTADELEVTAMGDAAHKFVKGLESATLTMSFLNDREPLQFLILYQVLLAQLLLGSFCKIKMQQ